MSPTQRLQIQKRTPVGGEDSSVSPLTERDLVVEQRLTTLEVLVDEVRGIADDARTMIAQVRVWMVIASAVGGAAVTVATGVAIWWMTK